MARASILLLHAVSIMSITVSSVWTTVLPGASQLDQEPSDPMSKDEETIKSLRDAIFKIQAKHQSEMEEMEEIVRAFNTLQLVANNPALMAGESNVESKLGKMGTGILNRRRRDDGQSTPAPSDGQQQTPAPLNPGDGQSYLGPYPVCSGTQCFLCPAGREGPRGPPGLQGAAGRDGRDGRDAVDQPCQPAEGPPSPIDVTTRTPPVAATGQPPLPFENKEGVVYTRWGKSDCGNGSELVYSGTMAGPHYQKTGSGSNWLCMPSDPIYDEVISGTGSGGRVYSAEYQTVNGPNSMRASHDHTPTCAVCMAPQGRTSKVMIPARNVCPSDSWRLEYAGYLMSSHYNEHRTDYICVDREMEFEPGSAGDQNGAVLYPVEAICVAGTGLPCAPYVTGYELTCAVCTI